MLGTLIFTVLTQGPCLAGKGNWPWLMGQREVAIGPMPSRMTIMALIFSQEGEPKFGGTNILPPVWSEYTMGRASVEVVNDVLFAKTCRVIKLSGLTTIAISRDGQRRAGISARVNWYVTAEGTILRQYCERDTPNGPEVADATYGETSIEVRRTDPAKKTTYATIELERDMARLQKQFVPMLEGDKELMSKKEFAVLDPFSGGLVSMKAELRGRFTFREGGKKYSGRMCEITAGDSRVSVMLTPQADIVQVDLGKSRFFKRTDPIDSRIGDTR